jgi:iron(III) transport system permease protein
LTDFNCTMGSKSSKLVKQILLAGYAFMVSGPLLALFWNLIGAIFDHTLTLPDVLALFSARKAVLLINSLALAGSVAITGIILGVIAASALWVKDSRGARILHWLLLATVVLPPYLHVLTWTSLFNRINLFLSAHSLPELPFGGWLGSWWVQSIAFLPIVVLVSQAGFDLVGRDLVEAARLQRTDMAVLKRIALPLAAPLVFAGGGLLFLLSLMDYSIPYIFGKNVYALDIFADFSAHNQPGLALLNALPLAITVLPVVLLTLGGIRTLAISAQRSERKWGAPPTWPDWFRGFQITVMLILIAASLAPLLTLVGMAGSPVDLANSLSNGSQESVYTLSTALLAGLICLPLALAAAQALAKPGRANPFWWLLTLLSLALPPALIGIGQIALWNHPILNGVYGHTPIVILTDIARFTPLAAILLASQERRSDPLLRDAARLFQKNPAHGWLRVHLPLLSSGLLASASIVTVLSAGELAATLIVIPPGQGTLTLRIYNFLHYGSPEAVAGLSLFLVLIVLLGSLITMILFEKRSILQRIPRNILK